MTRIVFLPQRESAWSDKTIEVKNLLIDAIRTCKLNKTKGFMVEFKDFDEPKSLPQLRAIHKLCDLAIPYLEKEHGIKYDRAKAKSFIKAEIGYMREPTKFEVAMMLKAVGIGEKDKRRKKAIEFSKKILQPESFALATKDKMIELIESIQAWAAENGFEGVRIDNKDLMAMLQYYKQ